MAVLRNEDYNSFHDSNTSSSTKDGHSSWMAVDLSIQLKMRALMGVQRQREGAACGNPCGLSGELFSNHYLHLTLQEKWVFRRDLKGGCGFAALFRADIPGRRDGMEINVRLLAEAGISGREEETGRRWCSVAQERDEQEETKPSKCKKCLNCVLLLMGRCQPHKYCCYFAEDSWGQTFKAFSHIEVSEAELDFSCSTQTL